MIDAFYAWVNHLGFTDPLHARSPTCPSAW